MRLIRISSPSDLPLSLAEVKAVARLDGLDDDDALIAGFLRSAVERVEGPVGDIQRALITQEWELRLDAFPGTTRLRDSEGVVHTHRHHHPHGHHHGALSRFEHDPRRFDIELPLPPLQSVTSVTYVADGSDVVLDADKFEITGIDDLGAANERARLRPVTGTTWPDTDDVVEAVKVRFIAGYGDNWSDVPEPIRQAIALMVANFYDGCESEAPAHLLRPYRVSLSIA